MRRANIELLAAARRGDANARYEVGRRYLLGQDGFQRHVPTGIEYLTHHSVRHHEEAAVIIAETLPLEELLRFEQEGALHRAAVAGSSAAQVKLGTRLCTRPGGLCAGLRWFEIADAAGHPGARSALISLTKPLCHRSLLAVLQAVCASGEANAEAIALVAAREALAEGNLAHLTICLQVSLALSSSLTAELGELVVCAIGLAERLMLPFEGITASQAEACLEMRANRGDRYAAHTLGRALCGVPSGVTQATSLVRGPNMRKGVAALLRAADGGCNDAWMLLYRISAAHKTSVSNPHAALLYLEKAAAAGESEAQRKLGALRMRSATCLEESETAISLLHQAATSGERYARELLDSLVLPLTGSDDEARLAIDEVRRHDAYLAARLELSRAFGLTRLEALTVDPAQGIRSWGLVVGANPFIVKTRLGAPRAVPARSEAAMGTLRSSASFFGRGQALATEGDLRRRSLVQRRSFERCGLDASMFFASATSNMLDTLRQGGKWAFYARAALRAALNE